MQTVLYPWTSPSVHGVIVVHPKESDFGAQWLAYASRHYLSTKQARSRYVTAPAA